APGFGERLLAPRIPIHGVVLVLLQVRAGFFRESVRHPTMLTRHQLAVRRLGRSTRPRMSEQPKRMMAQPARRPAVTGSPRSSTPQTIPKTGTRSVTVIAFTGPTSAMRR